MIIFVKVILFVICQGLDVDRITLDSFKYNLRDPLEVKAVTWHLFLCQTTLINIGMIKALIDN
jgi:hypothetical protein